jgi:ABC-type Fe3+ transport system substrate-binding protein
MTKTKMLVIALHLALVGVFVLAQIAGAGPHSNWREALEAAQKERKVVVSLPPNADLRKRIEEAFERRFTGIDLEPVPGRGSKSVRRIADEFKAGVPYVDVHVGGSASLLSGLVRPGYVDPIEPYLILPEVKDPGQWWGGHIYADKTEKFAYSFIAYLSKNIFYNKNLVDPGEIRSYDGLLNPKWKGKIGFFDPRVPGPGDATWTYLWEVMVARTRRVLADSLAKGKLAITIGVSFYSLSPFLKAGLPIEPLPIPEEGTYATGGTGILVVLKNPPHPSATTVFVNWFLGKEGQELFSKAMSHVTRRLDADSKWTRDLGVVGAREVISIEDYHRTENQSEVRIQQVRLPAIKFARKILK